MAAWRPKETGAKLIWRTTTPVPQGAAGRVPGHAAKYNQIAAAIMENRHARDIIQNATAFEQQVEFEFNGIPFHGFIDIVGNVVADLKSTQDVSASGFNRFVFNYNYHWQAALYLSAIGYSNEFMFIGIEANAPHNVMVYRLPQSVIDIAVRQLIEVTNEFKKWDGLPATYNNEIIDIQPPSWM